MEEVCWAVTKPACSAKSFERDTPPRQEGQRPYFHVHSWRVWSSLQLPLCPVPQAHVGSSAGQLASVRPSMAQAGAELGERGQGGCCMTGPSWINFYEENTMIFMSGPSFIS